MNFEMSKIYQENFQSSCRLAQLFPDTSAIILQEKSEIIGEFFSSSKNAIWPILLKYQEIDVQIQTFTSRGVHSQEMAGTEVPLVWVASFELKCRDGSQFLPFGVRAGRNLCHQV